MKFTTKRLFAAFGLLLLAGCQQGRQEPVMGENLVTATPTTVREIDSEKGKFLVVGNRALVTEANKGKLKLAGSEKVSTFLAGLATKIDKRHLRLSTDPAGEAIERDTSLVVGYPIGLLGEHQILGGVVTKLSDKNNEALGRLKLTDLTPVHVRPVVAQMAENQYALALLGCPFECSETSQELPIIGFPIVGIDQEQGLLLVDLAAVGEELNLVKMMDPTGSFTQLKTKTSKTVSVDYSYSTLVFDIETAMIPLAASETDADVKETVFTVRWYLKLTSVFNPAFESRGATDGIGFFMTSRGVSPKIQRFARATTGGDPATPGPVQYFVKNVPAEFRKAFASAFDAWNTRFQDVTGKKLITYEFVEATDPRYPLLVTGDVRYNIVEWDLDNLAPYGGLGPSIANQFTGQILSANVLVQGPKIVEIYKKWFNVSREADELRLAGEVRKANRVLRNGIAALNREASRLEATRFSLKVGDLDFNVRSQMVELEDPLFQRDDFDAAPTGVSYTDYMDGYFHDLVAHELGHDLGLRHNFRGNLGAADQIGHGKVSHSIMEYLNKNFRHLDTLGEYDTMAIRYGYAGGLPHRRDMFCTDENVPTPDSLENSAECSRDDATNDPFSFFEARLTKAVDLIVAKGSSAAPEWTPKDMERELGTAVTGLGLYSVTAAASGAKWTNFFRGGDRPAAPDEVPNFVLGRLQGQLCGASVTGAIAEKTSEEAKQKTVANIEALRTRVAEILAPLQFEATDLACSQ